MATTNNRQSWYPPVSAQPTPEEVARHLARIYQALNQHDQAIIQVNGKVALAPATQKTAIKRLKLP